MGDLFGADGIRGVVDQAPLTTDSINRFGKAMAAWLYDEYHQREPIVLVGTDTRESGQRLKGALINSLNMAGVATVDAEVLPTSAVSYLVSTKGFFSGGIMISASHNPVNENGVKVLDAKGVKLSNPAENHIENYYFGRAPLPILFSRAHNVIQNDYANQYADEMVKEFQYFDWHRSSILVDCANGAASHIAPQVLNKLGIRYTLLNAWPDGININRSGGSEHVRGLPSYLCEALQCYDLNLGFALDGDADRVVFVDRAGHFYDGDSLLALLAIRMWEKGLLVNHKVVSTPMSNSALKDYLKQYRIQLQTVPNGDKYITDLLLRENLILGGEQIGHLVIRTQPGRITGDGLRTALVILAEMASQPGYSLAEAVRGFHKTPQIIVSMQLEQRTTKAKEEIPGLLDLIGKIQKRWPDICVRECRPASTEAAYRFMLESTYTKTDVLAKCAYELATPIHRELCRGKLEVHIYDCVHGGMVLH